MNIKVFKILFIICGGIAEIWAISLIFNMPLTPDFLLFVILIPFLIYLNDYLPNYSLKLGIVLLFLIASILYFISHYVFEKSLIVSIILEAFLLFGFLYPLYFKKKTRVIVGFKDFYVAFLWSFGVLLYFIYYSTSITIAMILFLMFVYSRDLVNVSFCDLKDRETDHKSGLATLAISLGEKKYVYFMNLLNVLSVIIIIVGILLGLFPVIAWSLLFAICAMTLILNISIRHKSFSSYWADSEYYFWLLSIAVGGLV